MEYNPNTQRQATRAARIKKRKRQQRLFLSGCVAVLALLVLGIVLLVKGLE